jgi:transposase
VDGTYREQLLEWEEHCFRFRLEAVVSPIGQQGFTLLPRRGVVERTLRWFGCNRPLSKDYEGSTTSSEARVYIVMVHLMLRRLANA